MSDRHRGFELFLRSARPVLAGELGPDAPAGAVDAILADARREYARVLPEVPDIGGARNVFQPVMAINGWLAALHRAMKVHGHAAPETIRVFQRVVDGWLRKLPGFALRAIGWLLWTPPVRGYFARQARRSQERRCAEDFVWRLEQAPDGELSFVFDECAVNKWYDAQDLGDLKPYCNFVDVTYSRLMGMGVDAQETIGLGCQHCALRFKRGRETPIPPSLADIVPKSESE